MQLTFDRRARRLMRSVSLWTRNSVVEILLLAILTIQCARLVWAAATPVQPQGDWQNDGGPAQLAEAEVAILERFDPFFRSEASGPIVITELDIRLFGVRQNQASGRGSAIVRLPGGDQGSFEVGDEMMPDVTLESVGFDFITIARNGRTEQLFLDQSSSPVTLSTETSAAEVQIERGGATPIGPSPVAR